MMNSNRGGRVSPEVYTDDGVVRGVATLDENADEGLSSRTPKQCMLRDVIRFREEFVRTNQGLLFRGISILKVIRGPQNLEGKP